MSYVQGRVRSSLPAQALTCWWTSPTTLAPCRAAASGALLQRSSLAARLALVAQFIYLLKSEVLQRLILYILCFISVIS